MNDMKRTKPLVIQGDKGIVIGLEGMNPKAYQKSLENGVLWMVHGETARVLPFKEGAPAGHLKKLTEHPFGYTAVVDEIVSSEEGESSVAAEKSKEGISVGGEQEGVLGRLAEVIASRHLEMPEGSYTTHLFTSGADKIRKKLGEEAVELILAREKDEIVYEAADLFYHTLVLLEALDIPLGDIFAELQRRA